MASSYRERVYLGIDEEGHEIIKWASGDSKWELHDSIVRLYVKYGKIDRFLAEMQASSQRAKARRRSCCSATTTKRSGSRKSGAAVKARRSRDIWAIFASTCCPSSAIAIIYDIRPFRHSGILPVASRTSRWKTQKEHYNVLSNLFDYAMDDENVAPPAKSCKEQVRQSEVTANLIP